MDIEEYNKLQIKIMDKYKYKCLLVSDSVKFFRICSKISAYRKLELNYTTIKHIINIVKKEMV